MTVPAAVNNLRMAKRWLRFQTLAALVVAALAAMLAGQVSAYSSMFGSLAAFLPALVFTWIVARRFGADSGAFLRAAVLAECVKWLLCVVLCTVTFAAVTPLAAGWFFAGLCGVVLAGWLGLIFSN